MASDKLPTLMVAPAAWYGGPVGAIPSLPKDEPRARADEYGARGRTRRLAALRWAWVAGLALLAVAMYLAPAASAGLLVLAALGVPLARLVWLHPELGLLAMSFFTAGLVPRTVATVSLAGLRLDAADLTLLGLLALFVVRGLHRNTMELPRWSISGPLVAFAGIAVFSALYARFYQGVQLGLALSELRPAAYCAGCVVAAAMVTGRRQITILLAGLFVLADLIAGAIILRQFFGPEVRLVPGMEAGVWQVDQMSGAGAVFGNVRVVPPAHVLVYLMANVAFCLLLGAPRPPGLRALLALQLAFLGAGLLLTYTRAQWVASGIAVLLACALLPRTARAQLGRLLVVAAPALAVCLGLLGTGLVSLGGAGLSEALASRASSILTPDETLGTASLAWRSFENEAVFRALSERPWLGVGVGNEYRPATLFQGEAAGWLWDLDGDGRLTRFVHNGYFYIAVKMGLVAIAVFCWFCLAFLVSGAAAYCGEPDGTARLVVLAVICSFAGLLAWATFQPHFMFSASMTTVGLMVGIVAAVETRRVAATHDDRAPAGGWPAATVP